MKASLSAVLLDVLSNETERPKDDDDRFQMGCSLSERIVKMDVQKDSLESLYPSRRELTNVFSYSKPAVRSARYLEAPEHSEYRYSPKCIN